MDFAALSRILDDAVRACPEARLVEVADRLTGAVHEAVSADRDLLADQEVALRDELHALLEGHDYQQAVERLEHLEHDESLDLEGSPLVPYLVAVELRCDLARAAAPAEEQQWLDSVTGEVVRRPGSHRARSVVAELAHHAYGILESYRGDEEALRAVLALLEPPRAPSREEPDMSIPDFLASLQDLELQDEDGFAQRLELGAPAESEDLAALENRLGRPLPEDYLHGPAEEGLYAHVPEALRGRDCELWARHGLSEPAPVEQEEVGVEWPPKKPWWRFW